MGKSGSMFVAGLLTGLLGACLLGALVIRPKAVSGAAGQTVLKLGHGLAEQHPVHQGMLHMKERLEQLTGGRATIDIYPGGVLGNEIESLEQVQRGELAMTKVSTAALEAFIPEMMVFGIPFAFRDEAHFWNVLNGDIGERMLALGTASRFLGLCYYDSGDRNFYSKKKPIRSVADVAGMKIRVMNSRTAMDMIAMMKGSATPISWGELYTALEQGTVDAAENNWPSFVTSRHFEVCKYFTLSGHQRIPDMVIVSTKIWEGLPADIQKALRQAAKESEAFQRELWREETARCIASVKEQGVEIIEPDIEGFRKACADFPSQKEYQGLKGLYDAIQEVK
ncbi:MAG: TRAP transporter substrate-binding protein [Kiritimatiellaeota bacterium]|nr:TRAP transporter substrate-binding protein [Kiritimatiellota bacterium]